MYLRQLESTHQEKMSSEELRELELVVCPSAGACGGQFTANIMACVSEAICLKTTLLSRNTGSLRRKRQICFESGQTVMSLVEKN